MPFLCYILKYFLSELNTQGHRYLLLYAFFGLNQFFNKDGGGAGGAGDGGGAGTWERGVRVPVRGG